MVAQAAERLGGLHILVNSGSRARRLGHGDRPDRERRRRGSAARLQREVRGRAALRARRDPLPEAERAGDGSSTSAAPTPANAGNLSGGARNGSLVHLTKTLAVQLGRYGITVNCVHPGTTRTERTPRPAGRPRRRARRSGRRGREARLRPRVAAGQLRSAAWWTRPRSPIVTVFLASDKAWAVTGELVVATGGAGRSVYY